MSVISAELGVGTLQRGIAMSLWFLDAVKRPSQRNDLRSSCLHRGKCMPKDGRRTRCGELSCSGCAGTSSSTLGDKSAHSHSLHRHRCRAVLTGHRDGCVGLPSRELMVLQMRCSTSNFVDDGKVPRSCKRPCRAASIILARARDKVHYS